MSNGKMKVVIVEPGKPAYVSEIGTDLASMQKVVGGYIETIYFIDEPNVIMVGNEEAKLIGLEGNRRFGKAIVAGTFFISGQAESDDGMVFCSLTDELCDKFVKQFAIPEEISQEEVQSDIGFTVTTFGSTMSDTIRKQILAVRETGLTNMFDKNAVQCIAFAMDYYELVTFLEEHPDEYVNFILFGDA